MRSLTTAALLFFTLMASPALAGEDFAQARKIAALVEPYLEHQKVNAVSVGVLSHGKMWTGHFGTLDGAGTSAPNDRTIYELGSLSKVFTSLLLADAVESGQMKLDDPISSVMTQLLTKNPDVGNGITFQHLSHHVSGLPVMPTNIKPADSTNPFAGYDRELLTAYMLTVKPARKPGAGYEYSNLGVGLLGDLISRKVEDYESLLKQKLTGPLKMPDTGITLSADQAARFAPPHNAALLSDRQWDFDALAGCGAIRSNVKDMLLFLEASLNPPEGHLGKTIDLAWKQHKDRDGDALAMGLGWLIARDGSTRWHNGQTGGYQCMMLVSRRFKSATILLCNTAGSGSDALAEQIFQTVIGMDVSPISFEDDVQVDPQIVQRLAGRYQLAAGVVIEVKVKKGRMMAQITGQQFLALTPRSDTEWKYQAVDAVLKFDLPKAGSSPQVTLHQAGRVMPAPRMK